jgi:hypothetical protein
MEVPLIKADSIDPVHPNPMERREQTENGHSVSVAQVSGECHTGSESTDTDEMTENVPLANRKARRSQRLSDDKKKRHHRSTDRIPNPYDATTNLPQTCHDTPSDPPTTSPNRIKKLRSDKGTSPHRKRTNSKPRLKQ